MAPTVLWRDEATPPLDREIASLSRVHLDSIFGSNLDTNRFVNATAELALKQSLEVGKATRLTFINKLAWSMHEAMSTGAIEDAALVEWIAATPAALEALCADVSRRTFATYMFWDVVIVGVEDRLAAHGDRAHLFSPLAGALVVQRFSRNRELRSSAEHGLYHLSRAAVSYSEERDGGHPP